MKIKTCFICKKQSLVISQTIGVCIDCVRLRFKEAIPFIQKAHAKTREIFNLPKIIPKESEGKTCSICSLSCKIPDEGFGYCGLKKNKKNFLSGCDARLAKVSWYFDPLPTNCVADWICPGGTGIGYPQYAYKPSAEQGYYNLAVFFHACNLNCLYCQNWRFRELTFSSKWVSIDSMLSILNEKIACVCFFGGDPSPQAHFAIKFSQKALKIKKK